MQFGISGAPIPTDLRYAAPIQQAADAHHFFPLVTYAVAYRETISGEVNGLWTASTVVSPDNGHGLMQLTSSWPDDWQDPLANANYALERFLKPAFNYWKSKLEGDDLVRAIAASYNAGLNGAIGGHWDGDIDKFTTDRYGEGVLAIYSNLVANGKP